MFQEGVPMLLETIYGSEQAPRYFDSLWVKIRRYIQKAIDFNVFGFSGKLMVAPADFCVSDTSVSHVPLPENAISVPVDLYRRAISKLRPEWIEENGGLIAALSSFPFTGQHGMVKVQVFYHPKRNRCFYIGNQLADLVERDTDGDPFVAPLDEQFTRQCAAPYEYARAVRDAVNRRISNILVLCGASLPTITICRGFSNPRRAT